MRPSVVVSTYNGAAKLPTLLNALRVQTISDFELLVIVDGSTDGTIELLQSYRGAFSDFRVIVQNNGGRSKVRNKGASEAVGGLLIFYDDDMEPAADSIQRHMALHKDMDEILVSGNQLELEEEGKTDVQNYKASRVQRWMEKYPDVAVQLTVDNLFFTAANCSIRTSTFRKLQGFDERLTDAEDYFLARTALEKGYLVFFDASNVAIHRDLITARSYVRRLRQYQDAHRALGITSPDTQGSSSGIFKGVVYGMVAHKSWVRFIDSGFLTFLPKGFRYKLYDIIFHSLSVVHRDVLID